MGNAISVFPNPTNAMVNIKSDNVIDKVLIVNMFGKVVYQAEPNETTCSIEVDGKGMYFVIVTTNKQSVIRKVMVL
jgi:Secretion system C-terminal sorting domain